MLSTNYLETIRMLVANGIGWSMLPEIMHTQDIVFLQVPEMRVERQLGLIHHRRRTLSNAALSFIKICQQQAQGA